MSALFWFHKVNYQSKTIIIAVVIIAYVFIDYFILFIIYLLFFMYLFIYFGKRDWPWTEKKIFAVTRFCKKFVL